MRITNGDDRLTRLYLSDDEYSALRNCLNEVSGTLKIPEFERRIGGTSEQVRSLLRIVGELTTSGTGELGEVRTLKLGERAFIVQLSLEYTKLLTKCVFETCNGIALWEFHTRTGMQLETALGL